MLADPQSVTVFANAYSLPRIGSTANSGQFLSGDGQFKLAVSHAVAKRARHSIRLDHSKTAADPLQPATNRPYSMSAYLVMDVPLFGYTTVDMAGIVDGFVAYLAAGSGAVIGQVLASES
jgi:hypothetical protein